jgi:hypothetical protein
MEGKFASEGLQAIDGDDDMLTAMARELVENKGIGESADGVWRSGHGGRRTSGGVTASGRTDTKLTNRSGAFASRAFFSQIPRGRATAFVLRSSCRKERLGIN